PAAIAEQHSEHPLGEAIVRCARERNLPLHEYSQLRYSPGKGIVCEESSTRIFVGTRALFEENGVPVPADALFEVEGGNGAGKTVVLVGRDQKILGAVTLADQLRAEARQAVNDLKAQGYRVILLTGDSSDTARAIGREIGVDTVGIILAFFGLLAPIIAALIHVGSELAFILNSARLFRQPRSGPS